MAYPCGSLCILWPPRRTAARFDPHRMPGGPGRSVDCDSGSAKLARRLKPALLPGLVQRSTGLSSSKPSFRYNGWPMSVASSLIQSARPSRYASACSISLRARPLPRWSGCVSTMPIQASSLPKHTAVVVAASAPSTSMPKHPSGASRSSCASRPRSGSSRLPLSGASRPECRRR